MAFNPAPNTWLTGYSLTSNEVRMRTLTAGTSVTLEKLTDAQANASSGDVRDVFRALCYAMADAYSDKAAGSLPTKMRIVKSVVALPPSTTVPESLRETYTFTFDVESDPQAVIDE